MNELEFIGGGRSQKEVILKYTSHLRLPLAKLLKLIFTLIFSL